MEQDFFEKHYPQISKLYSVYTSDNLCNNAIMQVTEEYTSQLLEKAENLYKQGDNFETLFNAQVAFMEYGAVYNKSGFILGFLCAINLMRETK